jgi:hypothetical protein
VLEIIRAAAELQTICISQKWRERRRFLFEA